MADMGPEGFWTIEDLEQKIAHRRAFFFPGREAALVGQIEVYPGGHQVFQFMHMVGDRGGGAGPDPRRRSPGADDGLHGVADRRPGGMG